MWTLRGGDRPALGTAPPSPCLPWTHCPCCPRAPGAQVPALMEVTGGWPWASRQRTLMATMPLGAEGGAVCPHPTLHQDKLRREDCSLGPHWCQNHPETKSSTTQSADKGTDAQGAWAGVSGLRSHGGPSPKSHGSLTLPQGAGATSLGPSFPQHVAGWGPVGGS